MLAILVVGCGVSLAFRLCLATFFLFDCIATDFAVFVSGRRVWFRCFNFSTSVVAGLVAGALDFIIFFTAAVFVSGDETVLELLLAGLVN